MDHQRFPADAGESPSVNGGAPLKGAGWIETEVRPARWWEWVQIFVPVAALLLVGNVVWKVVAILLRVGRVK